MNIEQQEFLGQAQRQLTQLAAQLGVTATIDLRPDGLRVRLERDEEDARKEFDAYSWKFGYPKAAFGKTFSQNGTVYKIVGVKPTAEKNCFRIRRALDGKEFVCGKGFVGSQLLSQWAETAAA
jgi:hypothetical protein